MQKGLPSYEVSLLTCPATELVVGKVQATGKLKPPFNLSLKNLRILMKELMTPQTLLSFLKNGNNFVLFLKCCEKCYIT